MQPPHLVYIYNSLTSQGLNLVNMPEMSWYWADAASISPVMSQFWHITAYLQGTTD